MRKFLRNLSRRYAVALRDYLVCERESGLQRAYEVGRAALDKGSGVLNMARAHQEAIEPELWPATHKRTRRRRLKAAAAFFLEALSPFEIAQRGFSESNRRLQQLNATLADRNRELARLNRGLRREIARRKQEQEALRESERRFRLMVTNVKDYAIFMLNPDGRVASWNIGAEHIYGYTANDVTGRHIKIFHPREDRVWLRPDHMLQVARRTGHSEDAGWRVRKDRSRFFASVVITAIRDNGGRLRGFAKITRDITERKRTEEALIQSDELHRAMLLEAQLMQERLRDLSNKVIHAQEEERKRISRELHDEIGQAMTVVTVDLEVLKHNGAAHSEDLKQKITSAQAHLRETMERVHGFARELRPAALDELGLLPALRSHLKTLSQRTGLEVVFRGSALAEELGDEQKTVLFRVAQESLTNVVKHAHARRVEVSLRKLDNGICMEVADDGKSFPETPKASKKANRRLGLLGMEERVRLVNGRFAVKSQPGKGTTVRVVIPFSPSSARMHTRRIGAVRKALNRVFSTKARSTTLQSALPPPPTRTQT